ncbi:hypothetical protein L1987_66985 [Smallanthus sonchifolius]|uniref:Uncharacterized protein n=1 Tax=Smallanthus sonchifolius TaxID=185202 RepID=A0ACB9BYN3_9ASTR|nr:hypothetical protein L1987_66985 [Smallanthus sonchifolius]
MANLTNINEPPNVDLKTNNKCKRKSRKKSIVWEHFTVETNDDGCKRARCMHCKGLFAYISGNKLSGTSHLRRHITLGICPVSLVNEKSGQVIPFASLPTVNGTQDDNSLPRKRRKKTSRSTRADVPQQEETTLEAPEDEMFLSTSDGLSDFDVYISGIANHPYSVFDMSCKKMDRYRCSLKPSTLEALICAKDWLQHGNSDNSSDFSSPISPKSVSEQ